MSGMTCAAAYSCVPHVYIHTHIHVNDIFMYTYTHIYAYDLYIYTYNIYMYFWYVCIRTRIYIYIHVYIYVCLYACVCVCHTYIYMNTRCIYISCKQITTARILHVYLISCSCMSMIKLMCHVNMYTYTHIYNLFTSCVYEYVCITLQHGFSRHNKQLVL